jgi:aspartyl-tRNA(Asn)/glutamyl-tRNA(Gln) amidotransferase subunit B
MAQREELAIEPIIGLEVHVQLATRTKMWCGCAVEFGAPPNSRVCPVCLGLPGALPVLNKRAVEYGALTGLALNCQIATVTKWDRKNYYYPDLPKNYQISQYDLPLCTRGYFEIKGKRKTRRIRVARVHLEEDAGKNIHDLAGGTAVDLNRAGTPLLEIVTEPDFRSADEAREFAVQLQRLVRYLGVSEANMQKGQMRFEPNINVEITKGRRAYRTPIVEIKNLNSFHSLHAAVSYEIRRQIGEWQETGVVAEMGNKANRGWDDVREVTTPQREKEEAHDYRYFPDPDLVPLTIDPRWVEELRRQLPELPAQRTERFIREYKLPANDAAALVDCRATADLLDRAAEAGGDKATLVRHFLSFWSRHANERRTTIGGLGIPAQRMAQLANLVKDGKTNATAAAQIADAMVHRADELLATRGGATGTPGLARERPVGRVRVPDTVSLDPAKLAEELGLLQSSDEGEIVAWVNQAFAANEKAVRDAISNPKKRKAARGFLSGQVMKLSGGKANPKTVRALIDRKLAEITNRS